MATASEEIKLRLSQREKALIRQAAAIEGRSVSEFLRAPALQRAEQVLAEASPPLSTLVPSSFYDDLVAALDEPPSEIPALAEAAARLARLDIDAELR
jgi:uncharacterized protein (DUF1778 family)